MQDQIKADPEKAIIMSRFLADVSEYRYEKAYIEYEIEDLCKKFPELLNDSKDSKPIVVFRSGILDKETEDAIAKNRYQAYTEEEHIESGGDGTHSKISTEYLSVTESAIVLPVYNLSKRDKDKFSNEPMIIDIRKIYELLVARRDELANGVAFDGEEEFLELIFDMDFGENSDLKREEVYARLERLDALNKYKRNKSLPEGFFDRQKLKAPKKGGKDPYTYAYSSAELLFKAAIPSEAITRINPLVMDMMVATVGTEVYDKFIEKIISGSDMGKNFSDRVIDLINDKEKNDYGLNPLEQDFIQRFYINGESIDKFISVPELTEADENIAYKYTELKNKRNKTALEIDEMKSLEKQLEESGISKEELEVLAYLDESKKNRLKDINVIRKEQVELGIRTSIVKKILGNEKFLQKIGINLEEMELTPELFQSKLGLLVQATTSGPESKHRRYDFWGNETYTENTRPYIIKYNKKPKVEGIIAKDRWVSITSKGYSIQNGVGKSIRYVRPKPKAIELEKDKGEIQYATFSVQSDADYNELGHRLSFSFISSTATLIRIPFQVKHCAKAAAKKLEKIVTYYLEEKKPENNIQDNTTDER